MRLCLRYCWLILLAYHSAYASSDKRFTVISVNTHSEKLQLFWSDENGIPFKNLEQLSLWLKKQGKTLLFGMNAGMYHKDLSPVGLLVLKGDTRFPLNLADGAGNFFLKPNGVFVLTHSGPHIVSAEEYSNIKQPIIFATQSGPLLLKNGKIHSAFNAASTSRFIRNGVGVANNLAIFVISNEPVNFYEFASFFKDVLHCQNALYFDGAVSSLFSEQHHRSDKGSDLGPLIGVIK